MSNVDTFYSNDFGISFRWTHITSNLTQIVFGNIGFHLSEQEIEGFLYKVSCAKQQKNCPTCSAGVHCKSILLQTPSNKISMAVSIVELEQIEDLLKGTLFQIRLNNYLHNLCK